MRLLQIIIPLSLAVKDGHKGKRSKGHVAEGAEKKQSKATYGNGVNDEVAMSLLIEEGNKLVDEILELINTPTGSIRGDNTTLPTRH